MPIKFISLDKEFIEKVWGLGYEGYVMRIENYVPDSSKKRTYYVSPANSLCFMDGGIDLALSRIVFPGIERRIKTIVKYLNHLNLLGRTYLPIGSSIIEYVDEKKALVVSPTMLLPQNVSKTKNAYYTTMAILYNILINRKEVLEDIDILFTSFCCGYGKMDIDTSIQQIEQGIKDYVNYKPTRVLENIVFHEANLEEQPKYYQNSEWFKIRPEEIVRP